NKNSKTYKNPLKTAITVRFVLINNVKTPQQHFPSPFKQKPPKKNYSKEPTMQRSSVLSLCLLSECNNSVAQVTSPTAPSQASSSNKSSLGPQAEQAFYTMLLPYQPQAKHIKFV